MDIFVHRTFHSYFEKSPLRLIDVGASGGLQNNWKRAARYLEVVGFEPDKRSFGDLKKDTPTRRIYINSALHKERKTVNLHLTQEKQLSSLFTPKESFLRQFPASERYRVYGTSRLQADTLDGQLEKHGIGDADFVKLDTQGSELFILEGGRKTLDSVFGLEIETEFTELYEGQALFSDIDTFMRSLGFQLFDLKPYYWKRERGRKYGSRKGQIIFADSLYFLKLEKLRGRLARIESENTRKEEALHAVSIALLYGYLDYALSIFELEKRLFNSEETELFYKAIRKNKNLFLKIPRFRGKGKIARVFKIFYNMFRYYENDWATSEDFLGNRE